MKTRIFFSTLAMVAVAGQIYAQNIDLDSLYVARVRAAQIASEQPELVPVAEEPVAIQDSLPADTLAEILVEPLADTLAQVADTLAETAPEEIEIEPVTVATHAVGVNIDGLLWASRNVATTAGEFAAERGDTGGYFSFVEAQTVCPEGWRLPSKKELTQLAATPNTWTNPDGAPLTEKRQRKHPGNGVSFGLTDNAVFLPAAGYLDDRGKIVNKFPSGFYWSDKQTDNPITDKNGARGAYLRFDTKKTYTSNNPSFDGRYTVRCVK